jgi:hypothetical protein
MHAIQGRFILRAGPSSTQVADADFFITGWFVPCAWPCSTSQREPAAPSERNLLQCRRIVPSSCLPCAFLHHPPPARSACLPGCLAACLPACLLLMQRCVRCLEGATPRPHAHTCNVRHTRWATHTQLPLRGYGWQPQAAPPPLAQHDCPTCQASVRPGGGRPARMPGAQQRRLIREGPHASPCVRLEKCPQLLSPKPRWPRIPSTPCEPCASGSLIQEGLITTTITITHWP